MTERTNAQRSQDVQDAMIKIYGSCDSCDVTDIITDLMHYCQRHGINFDQALNMATDHFSSETE